MRIMPAHCPLQPESWRGSWGDPTNGDLLRWYWGFAQVCSPHPRCVEIGVAEGRSLTWLAGELLALGWDRAELWGVDPYDRPARAPGSGGPELTHHAALKSLYRYGGVDEIDLIRLIGAPSIQAARLWDPGSLDLVMIDGDHREEAVRADILAWLPLIRPGGVVAGHDYGAPQFGVTAAVDDLLGRRAQHYQRVWWVEHPAG